MHGAAPRGPGAGHPAAPTRPRAWTRARWSWSRRTGPAFPSGTSRRCGALTRVFGPRQGSRPTCGVGTIKSMIGHCRSASGIAGIIKATLALHHKIAPAHAPLRRAEPGPEPGRHSLLHQHGNPALDPAARAVRRGGRGERHGVRWHQRPLRPRRVPRPTEASAEQPRRRLPRLFPAELFLVTAESRAGLVALPGRPGGVPGPAPARAPARPGLHRLHGPTSPGSSAWPSSPPPTRTCARSWSRRARGWSTSAASRSDKDGIYYFAPAARRQGRLPFPGRERAVPQHARRAVPELPGDP